MYAYLWRILPGPTAMKVLLAVLLFLAFTAVLFIWVFPAVMPHLPFNDVTVSGSDSTG